MKASTLLRDARSRIDTPEKWVKGHGVICHHDGSMSYCAHAAIERTCCGSETLAYGRIMTTLDGFLWPKHTIVSFNDTPSTTHKDIMDLFDKAINQLAYDEKAL